MESGTFFIPFVESGGGPCYASILLQYTKKLKDDLKLDQFDPMMHFFRRIDPHNRSFQGAKMGRDLFNNFAKVFFHIR